jgi:hypothetical protein
MLQIGNRVNGRIATLAYIRTDGAFAASWLGPDSRLEPVYLPFGYYVQSFMQGSTNLLAAPASDPAEHVVLTLTRKPPAGVDSARVTGRVSGLENYPTSSSRWIQFQSSMLDPAEVRVGEALVRSDGTFEIVNVIPGTYRIRLEPLVPGMAGPPPVVVPAGGLQNVELRFTPRPAQ